MKNNSKYFQKKTIAFVSAMLIAFAGISGTFAQSGIRDMLSVSAEDSIIESNLVITQKFFSLGDNANNKVDFYYFQTTDDGTVDFDNKDARRLVFSINGKSEDISLPEMKANETCIAYRVLESGDYDYFTLNDTATGWIYLGTNFRNVNKKFDNWLIEDENSLEEQTWNGNDISASTTYSFTSLNQDGSKKTIATISGKANTGTLSIPYDSKYTYFSIHDTGGYHTGAYANTQTTSYWNTETETWDTFAVDGKHQESVILGLFVNDAHFPMLSNYDVQEVRILKNGEVIQTFDKKTFDGGYGAVTQKFERGDGSTTMGFCAGEDYESYSWEADVINHNEYQKLTYDSNIKINGKFLANVPYTTFFSSLDGERHENDYYLPPPAEYYNEDDVPVYYLPEPAMDIRDEQTVVISDEVFSGELSPTAYWSDSSDSRYTEIEKGNHGNVYLLKNADIIESYSAGDFDNGAFTIPDYDSYSDYFLKIAHDSNEEFFTYYKWSEKEGKWKFRVNTEETPIASVPVTYAEFANYITFFNNTTNNVEGKENKITMKFVSGDVETPVLSEWSKEEFDNGSIVFEMPFALAGTPTLDFYSYAEGTPSFGYEKTWIEEVVTFTYVGIDPVYVGGWGTFYDEGLKTPTPPPASKTEIVDLADIAVPVTNASKNDVNEGTTGTIRLLRINPDNEDNLISSIPYTSDDFRFASYAFEYEDDSYYFLEVETSKDSHEYLYLKWKDENHGWSFSSLVYEPQKAMEILNRPWIYKLSMENVWLNPDIINTIKVYTLNNGIRTEKFHISDKNVIGYGFVFNDFVFHSSMNCQNRVDYECSDGFTYTYLFVGTEPVLISKINTATGTTTRKLPNRNILAGAVNGNRYVVEVPTNARKNDKIVIYGKTIAGVDINYTVTQEHYDDSVVFPVGEYTVINQTTGKKADVVITEDGYTGGEYINLTNPDEISTYSVKSPDGAVLSEGIYQGSLSSFDDIGISGNKLRSKYYAIFETKSGVNNSIYSDDMTISKGYMGVKNDELETVIPKSQLTGDINSDHTVNVADIVKQQKYLFKQENLDLESYVNADMNHDGKVNVIDLALLKKQLLNQS